MKKKYWIYFEPYVHISQTKNDVIIYNTLNGSILEYKCTHIVFDYIRKMLDDGVYIFKITEDRFTNKYMDQFILNIRNNFMGDYVDIEWSKNKPFIPKPEITVEHNFSKYKGANSEINGLNPMVFLNELTVYVNNNLKITKSISTKEIELFSEAFKQFHFLKFDKFDNSISLNQLNNLLSDIRNESIYQINILGGDILLYPYLETLLKLLNSINIRKSFYFYFKFIDKRINLLKLVDESKIVILVSIPIDNDVFKKLLNTISINGSSVHFHFIVINESDLDIAHEMIGTHSIENAKILPFYNGNNLDFFSMNVFINKEDILASPLSQSEILARNVVNTNNFGKLTLDSDGLFYSNFNLPSLGNIYQDSIKSIILKEMSENNSWGRTRSKQEPCIDCLYNLLCPSPSNYEFVIGKPDLCDLN